MPSAVTWVDPCRVGHYDIDAPWRQLRPDDQGAAVLGVAPGTALTLPGSSTARSIALPATGFTGMVDGLGMAVVTSVIARPCGGPRVVVSAARVERDDAGNPVRVRGYLADLTDVVETETAGTGRAADLTDASLLTVIDCGPFVVLVVAGELDLSNRALFVQALHHAVGTGDRDVHLDARHVRFCDARSVALLADAAGKLRPGRQMVVWYRTSVLNMMLTTILADQLTGAPVVLVYEPGAAGKPCIHTRAPHVPRGHDRGPGLRARGAHESAQRGYVCRHDRCGRGCDQPADVDERAT